MKIKDVTYKNDGKVATRLRFGDNLAAGAIEETKEERASHSSSAHGSAASSACSWWRCVGRRGGVMRDDAGRRDAVERAGA